MASADCAMSTPLTTRTLPREHILLMYVRTAQVVSTLALGGSVRGAAQRSRAYERTCTAFSVQYASRSSRCEVHPEQNTDLSLSARRGNGYAFPHCLACRDTVQGRTCAGRVLSGVPSAWRQQRGAGSDDCRTEAHDGLLIARIKLC